MKTGICNGHINKTQGYIDVILNELLTGILGG